MQVCLRLFGTLPSYYQGDYPPTGLDLETVHNISVAELIEFVELPQEQVAIVSINGMLAKAADTIPARAEVKFFQPLNGG